MDRLNQPEEGTSIERRTTGHDPKLKELVNPDYSPQINDILKQVQAGFLATESAHEAIMQMLTEIASEDRKTGLDLGEAVAIKLERLMKYSREESIPLTVVYLDADHFKRVNDVLGHDIGDVVIGVMAEALRQTTRDEDIQARLAQEPKNGSLYTGNNSQARMGGDEFIMVLPGANAGQAGEVLNRFRVKCSDLIEKDVPQYLSTFGSALTVSAGIAQYNPDPDQTPLDLIKRADAAMRESKQAGNGGVRVAVV